MEEATQKDSSKDIPNLEEFDQLNNILDGHDINNVIRGLSTSLGYEPNVHIPTIEEFYTSKFYLGNATNCGDGIYDYWKETLKDIFPNPLYQNYQVCIFRGAIGIGKSTVASLAFLYVLAKLILMHDPHGFFGLLKNKDMIAFLYSIQKNTIMNALVKPINEMIESSPFFKKYMNMEKKGLHFKNKLTIQYGSEIRSNIGKDIPLVIMDEIQQQRLKNQVKDNYNSLKARIKSRFMLDNGIFFNSLMVLVGSAGGEGDFAQHLTEEARDDPGVKLIEPPQWEVLKSKVNYSGKTFKLFIGSDSSEPKILQTEDEVIQYAQMEDEDLIMDVPIEYFKEFEEDIYIALRDLAGVTTRSSHSLISNVSKLSQVFKVENKFFGSDKLIIPFFDSSRIVDKLKFKDVPIKSLLLNANKPRFIHIDIGVVSDLTGISMVHIADYVETKRYDYQVQKVTKSSDPWYITDFSVGIGRRKSEETSIPKIRDFIFDLRNAGIILHTVTCDGYQSTQLIQELKMAGINAYQQSVIRDSSAYDIFKRAAYEDRVIVTKNKLLFEEFKRLVKVIKNGKVKVHHPSTKNSGSHGDIAESLVGALKNAYLNSKNQNSALSSFSNFNANSIAMMQAGVNTNIDPNNFEKQENFDLLIRGI